MRILLTNDLHNVKKWYDWLIEVAPKYDLLVIAGDLYDGFDNQGLLPQIIRLQTFTRRIRSTGCAIAFCTGNHDGPRAGEGLENLDSLKSMGDSQIEQARELLQYGYWCEGFSFADEAHLGGVVADGKISILRLRNGEKVVISTHPYSFDFSENERSSVLWHEAVDLRKEHDAPWIVVHHEPPKGTKVGGHYASDYLVKRIDRHIPDIVVSGHEHTIPYMESGDWATKVGGSWCFNAGMASCDEADIPNHTILDTNTGEAVWQAAHQEDKPKMTGKKNIALRKKGKK